VLDPDSFFMFWGKMEQMILRKQTVIIGIKLNLVYNSAWNNYQDNLHTQKECFLTSNAFPFPLWMKIISSASFFIEIHVKDFFEPPNRWCTIFID
jgi:hypothetical protein